MKQGDAAMIARVERLLESLSTGKVADLADLFAADIVYRVTGQHPFSGEYEGRQVIMELAAGMNSRFRHGVVYAVDRIIAADQTVVAMFTGIGTLVNGNQYRNQYCTIWDFDDDQRIAKITEYFDSYHMVSVGE